MTYWEELSKWDLIDKLKPLIQKGAYYYDKDTCKIKKHEVLGVNVPWLFIKRPSWMNCAVWHQVYFQCLRAIHSQCLKCYKVAVTPSTVRQLFDLYDVMLDMNLPSKCGIDLRNYTKARYGAYFYAQSVEEGQEIYQKVRDRLSRRLDLKDMPIILKRGCTEFELYLGDSAKYEQSEDDKEWERIVEANVDIPDWDGEQPQVLKNHIKRLWIAFAYRSNDMTSLEFNDGKDLITPLREYHMEGDQDDGRHGDNQIPVPSELGRQHPR